MCFFFSTLLIFLIFIINKVSSYFLACPLMCLSGQFSAHLGVIDNYHTCTILLIFLQFDSSLGLCFTDPCCSVQFGLLVAFVLQLELSAPVLKLTVYVANAF